VLSAYLQDNDTPATVVDNGITMEPHSVAAVVHPAGLTAAQKLEVWEALYLTIPVGIKPMGTQVGTVTGEDLAAKIMRYFEAVDVVTDVRVTVILETGFVIGDVTAPIQSIASDFGDTLSPGETTYGFAIEALIGADPSSGGVEGVASAVVEFNIGAGWVNVLTPTALQINAFNAATVTT